LVANLPPRNPTFTGRTELLDQLHTSLHPGQAAAVVQIQAQALHGLGGIGKTQLALEYAHAHAHDYDLVWWVVAEQPAAISGQLVALARRLGIPEAADQGETIAVLYDELRGRDRWLVVFDNAEDPADLRPWWPPDSGRVLVTSRNPTWAGLAATIALDVPPRGEAVSFLQLRLGRDDPAFEALTAALGDLPLGLEQAAAYLNETAINVGDYLGLLGERSNELFALGQPATTEQTIATTWTVALQRLREQTPAAEDLLSLCAFLAAEDIPRDLPTQHPDLLPERLATAVQDPLAYQQAVGALRRYSLIKTSQDGQALSVHRLVQTVVRNQLEPEQEHQWATTALRLLDAAVPGDTDDPATWSVHARFLPHLLTTVREPTIGDLEPRIVVRLLARAGGYLRYRIDFDQAGKLLQQAVRVAEVRLGHDDLDTAWSLHILASVLADQGDLDGARTLHQRALSIREARLGADHPATAHSLNNLANVLRDQGDLDRAHTLHQRALTIREARLGADHPDTATSLSNLANVLYNQGDLDGARTLYQRALTILEARLGADHPDTVQSRQRLAAVVAALDNRQ
jgi:tetratricopeptide (TPR) repeat protein